jgi:Na+/H+ antiporter NhaD/arsenite permease-like protein
MAVAAAGAFLTPIATPTNLMVIGPGGYAFGDYWKLGLPRLIRVFRSGGLHRTADLAAPFQVTSAVS